REFAFIPCGHLCACEPCSIKIVAEDAPICPMCRGQANGTIHIKTNLEDSVFENWICSAILQFTNY
ncbi:hypothetical protein GPALN_006961, partial [Globodera pallida]